MAILASFPIWQDERLLHNYDRLDYYVTFNDETIFRGRAFRSPKNVPIELDINRIVGDWLENGIDPEYEGVLKQENAWGQFKVWDQTTGYLLAEYGVMFNWDQSWSGESKVLSEPVNGKMDPRMRLFWSKYNVSETSVVVEGEDIYYFDADDAVAVAWDAGRATVGIRTNYSIREIVAVCPAGVRTLTYGLNWLFEVPTNFTDNPVTHTIQWYRNGVLLDQTVITVGAYSAYFNCPASITVSGDGTYFEIPFQTDIPLYYIEAVPGTGLRLVSLNDGVARFWAEPSESLSGYTTSVVFRNTARNETVGQTSVIVSAPQYYFIVAPLFSMNCDGGTLTIPVNTVYDMQEVRVNLPAGVTLLSKAQTGITVSVVANTSTTDKAYHSITFQRGRIIGRTTIEVGVFTYYFNTVPTVLYNPYDDENVVIPWSTNIPISEIGIILPSGSTLVSVTDSGVTITHPTQDGSITFTYKGSVLATVAVKSLAEEYFTCVALTQGYLPWTSEFEVKINGGNWQTLNPSGGTGTLLQVGDVAFVRGNVDSPLFNSADHLWPDTHSTDSAITSNLCDFDAYGNILSMLYGDSYETATGYTGDKSLAGALSSTRVKDASGVILPAFTKESSEFDLFWGSSVTVPPIIPYVSVIEESAYENMFLHCTDLQFAPEINAGTIGIAGCKSMFFGCTGLTSAGRINVNTVDHEACLWMYYECTSLVVAPDMSTITTIVDTSTTTPGNHFRSMFEKCSSLTTPPPVLKPLTTIGDSYCEMFKDCTSLLSSPEIDATTVSQYCCANMFNGCTSLRTPPSILKAVTLQKNCYGGMFEGCVNLSSAPVVNATTLADECCTRMFYGCRSLATAPDLLAQLSSTHCYEEMFYGCTSLNYIKCMLQQRYSINGDIRNWVAGVSATGTFVKRQGTDWNTGYSNSGIPTGWTVIEI